MDKLTKKGEEVYKKLLPSVLPHYPGFYIIIAEDGEYWINEDMIKAVTEAKIKYPYQEFYIAKIGAEEGAIASFK